jgi:hypothetical protein
MPFRTRVSQLLALALLLLSPGAGGLVLEIGHPCPGEAAPEASATGHAHHADAHHSGQQGPEHGDRCCCFGACSLALQFSLLPQAAAPVTAGIGTAHSLVLSRSVQAPRAQSLRLLPPATAPPTSLF